MDATPMGDMAFLMNGYGRAFTSNGFGNKFRDWCDAAGLLQCSAHAVDDLVAQGAPAFEVATPMLSQLLKAEMAEREVRSSEWPLVS